jgi:hypothetical protein
MKHITWHPVRDSKELQYDFEKKTRQLEKFSTTVRDRPLVLTSLSLFSQVLAIHAWKELGNRQQLLDQLRFAHIAATWHWKAMLGNGPFTIVLPGIEAFSCGRVKDNSDSDFGAWLSGIQLAMIFRDKSAMKVYLDVTYQDIVERDDMTLDPWCEPYMNFLKGVSLQDPNLLTYLYDALQKLDPSLYEPERANFLLEVMSPIMELWAVIFLKPLDQDKFDAALLDSQESWKRFYSTDFSEDFVLTSSYYEYMDKATLMAVIYAGFRGFKVNLKSDYLPEFLIKGDFPKLEWPDPEWKS